MGCSLQQRFFEMHDIRPWQGAPWVPLRMSVGRELPLPDGSGAVSVWDGVATLAVPEANRAQADGFGWSEVGIQHNRSVVDRDGYHAADSYRVFDAPHPIGTRLVVAQLLEELHKQVWHLHPDLVVALHLLREGDVWFRPEEGWAEVARLFRNADGDPERLEIRSEHLSDYLAATGSLLFLSSYHERRTEPDKLPAFDWPEGSETVENGRDSFERRFEQRRGRFRVSGALWRTEWFGPGDFSPRVRGDRDRAPTTFTLDNQGGRATADELQGAMDWLYFRPDLVSALSRHRGFHLGWLSAQTGGLGGTGRGLHFGINQLGLINVFAKDVGRLAPWEQRIWSAHNVPPEGGVSRELFAAQMEVRPPATKAPETELPDVLDLVEARVSAALGAPLLRANDATVGLIARVHRFRAADDEGLLLLARDLAKLFAERVDVDPIHRRLALKANEKKPGSLKSLERLAATKIGADDARTLMAPLFGVQDLRGAAAHLGDDLVPGAIADARVDPQAPATEQGRMLIASFVETLTALANLFADPAAP